MLLFSWLLASSPKVFFYCFYFGSHLCSCFYFIFIQLTVYQIHYWKKGNLLRTGLQPTEHCKSMVVSESHWNLLICYDIVLYTVWNTDSFPLYGFWSLNLFLCQCWFTQIPGGSPMDAARRGFEGFRGTAEVFESFTYIFIMKYFKNKLITWKKCPMKI